MNFTTNRLLALVMLCCTFALGNNVYGQCAAGESEVIIDVVPSGFPAEISWELLDMSSAVVASAACASYGPATSDTLCLTTGDTYTFNALDDWGDGWNGGTYSVTVDGVLINTSSPNNGLPGDGAGGCGGDDLEESYVFIPGGPILGCTDPTATNYNPAATVDDGSCVFPSSNDDCDDAIDIPLGTCATGNLIGATYDSTLTAPAALCAGLTTGTALDIWFTVTVPASGNLLVETPVVPGITSTLEFMTGPCSALAAVPGLPCTNYGPGGSVILSGLTGGSVLYIRYFDFGNNDEGPYEICVSEPTSGCTDPCASNFDSTASIDDGSCMLPALTNDDCAAATALPGPGTYDYYNGGATGTDITSCTSTDTASIWYSYMIPTGLDTFRVYTCGSSFDTGLSLWDGCDTTATELACNDDGTPGGGSTCDGSSFQSLIELTDSALMALEGTTVLIRVAGFGGQSGCGDLIIEEVGGSACDASVAVTNLTATVGASTLDLSWDPVPGAIGYQINYGPSGGPFVGTNNSFGPATTATVPLAIIPAGNYQIRVRAGCQISPTIIATMYSNVVQITVPGPRMGEFAEVTLSPNPATDVINLAYNGAANQNVSFSIVNILGSEVANITTDVAEGLNNMQFDISTLESGVYFLQITSNEGSFSEQFEVIK